MKIDSAAISRCFKKFIISLWDIKWRPLTVLVFSILLHAIFIIPFSYDRYQNLQSNNKGLLLDMLLEANMKQNNSRPRTNIVPTKHESQLLKIALPELKKEPEKKEEIKKKPEEKAPVDAVYDPNATSSEARVYIPSYNKDRVKKQPQFLIKAAKEYPAIERERNVEGLVIVELEIDETGNVHSMRIYKSGGKSFDTAALDWLKQCSFSPALDENNQPIAVRIQYPVRFSLTD